ncbi:MAG: 2-hydroxyacid dehydrogenase [Cellulomonadaceae bacterium]|jgi:phosphoglycerate dehydrogenase-like enzyme|nr:2-hydroxyacid dehydrogenase [Cellulomonadaceae bacterium]
MLTVTVADEDLYGRLADMAARPGSDRVEVILWDLTTDLPDDVADRVDMVCIGHYFSGADKWQRIANLPNLRVLQIPSAGFEHALPYTPPGVILCNGRGIHSAATSELALALTLASQRGLAESWDAQRQSTWLPFDVPALAGRRVLVVGAGSVALAVRRRLLPFEVEVTMVGRTARTVVDNEDPARAGGVGDDVDVQAIGSLLDLLACHDITILTVPSDASTRHLMDAAALAAMPDGALLVNVARGPVVDTDALVAEVAAGRLRVALDVTDPEPLPEDHPLWTTANTLITAHLGGRTDSVYPRTAALVRRQIEHLLAAEPLENVVNN